MPRNPRPNTLSEPYEGAVSKYLIPHSIAASSTRLEFDSSAPARRRPQPRPIRARSVFTQPPREAMRYRPNRHASAMAVKVGLAKLELGNTAAPATYRLSVPNTRQFSSTTPSAALDDIRAPPH